MMLSYDRVAARQNRPPSALERSTSKPTITRPSTSSLTLANSNSLHLLTVLEQQLCSTLRILPRPYLFLKEALLREWVKSGGKMGLREARKVVVKGDKEVGGEWGEKIERVWEFLVETGLGRRDFSLEERKKEAVVVEGGDGRSMMTPVFSNSVSAEGNSKDLLLESKDLTKFQPVQIV